MEENNVMLVEENEVDTEVYMTEDTGSGMSTGVAMLLGGLLTAGTMYGVKKVKGFIAKRKAKKEADAPVEETTQATEAPADTKKKSK